MELVYCDCCAKRIGLAELITMFGYERKAEKIMRLSIEVNGKNLLKMTLCKKCYDKLTNENIIGGIRTKALEIWKEKIKEWFPNYTPAPTRWQRLKNWFPLELKRKE